MNYAFKKEWKELVSKNITVKIPIHHGKYPENTDIFS